MQRTHTILSLLSLTAALFLASLCFAATEAAAFFSEDFENTTWNNKFGAYPTQNIYRETGAAAHSGLYGLRIHVTEGKHRGATIPYDHSAHGQGNLNEIWARYYVKFDQNWNRSDSPMGKTGFNVRSDEGCGAECLETSDSHRLTTSGLIEGQSYFHQNVADSDIADWENLSSTITATSDKYSTRTWTGGLRQRDQWYCVETHIKLNTPSVSNGVYQNWVDGALVSDSSNLLFRQSDTFNIDMSTLKIYIGGGWVSDRDMDVYFDDWAVSDERIGCDGATPNPPTPTTPASSLSTQNPLDLTNLNTENLSLNVSPQSSATHALITLNITDADTFNEGYVIINNRALAVLFGKAAKGENNNTNQNITLRVPVRILNTGTNTFTFKHRSSDGYLINSVRTSFETEVVEPGGGSSDPEGADIPPGANILWEQDFDGVPQVSSAQILTLEKAEQFFGTPGTVASLGESNKVLLSPDPANSGRGNVLELFHPKDDCRFGFRAEVKRGLSLSEVYYSYDVYVRPDYITPFGMKNGLRIQSQSSGNGTGVYYTSAASMHSDVVTRGGENSLVSYIYQEEGRSRSGKGKSYEWDGTADGQANLPFGRWANIKVRTKINTFDSSGNARADGEVQAWLDGEEVFLKRDFTFTESDMPGAFRSLLFLNYYGGDCRNSDQWFSPQDQSEFYDNLVFWTQ